MVLRKKIKVFSFDRDSDEANAVRRLLTFDTEQEWFELNEEEIDYGCYRCMSQYDEAETIIKTNFYKLIKLED